MDQTAWNKRALPQIETLAEALKAHAGRDEYGDPFVGGDRGNIHVDGEGFSLSVITKSRRGLTGALKKLNFCEVKQRGDWEAVIYLPKLPTRAQATAIRDVLKIPKVFEFSPEVLNRKREAVLKARKSLIIISKQPRKKESNLENETKSISAP